jgi:hypothetical protein
VAEKYIRELGQLEKDVRMVGQWSKEKKEEQVRRLTVRSSWSDIASMSSLNNFAGVSMRLFANLGVVLG